jgi:hypothetical protein
MAAGDTSVVLTKNRAFPCNVFDGVDDYVEIPHNAAQLGANLINGFTISAWINPRSAGEGAAAGSGKVIDKTSGLDTGFTLQMRQDSSKVNFYMKSANKLTETNAVTFGTWNHYLITISNATPSLGNMYKNGSLTGTANTNLGNSISNITNIGNLQIGNMNNSTAQTFDGSIRNFKMWNKVLTAAEITADYAGVTPALTNLIHFFKLGGDYTDYGFVGVAATNSGSLPQVVNDTIAAAVKAQRATTGATGKFMIYKGAEGQVNTVAITEA